MIGRQWRRNQDRSLNLVSRNFPQSSLPWCIHQEPPLEYHIFIVCKHTRIQYIFLWCGKEKGTVFFPNYWPTLDNFLSIYLQVIHIFHEIQICIVTTYWLFAERTSALWAAPGHFSFQCKNTNFVEFTNEARQSTQSQNNIWELRLEYETGHLSNGFHHILKWKSYGFLSPRN